jgi:hypothetical protein
VEVDKGGCPLGGLAAAPCLLPNYCKKILSTLLPEPWNKRGLQGHLSIPLPTPPPSYHSISQPRPRRRQSPFPPPQPTCPPFAKGFLYNLHSEQIFLLLLGTQRS